MPSSRLDESFTHAVRLSSEIGEIQFQAFAMRAGVGRYWQPDAGNGTRACHGAKAKQRVAPIQATFAFFHFVWIEILEHQI